MKNKTKFLIVLLLLVIISGSVYCSDFQAYYTKINSGEAFEKYSRTGDYADIVVEVMGGKFVFWRGSSYLPYWETIKGKWYVEELVSRRGDGDGKRPDKVNTYSRISLVESSNEQAVIYWRYLPEFSGTNPHLGVEATKFVEEYFTITKDGIVTRTCKKGTKKIDDWRDPNNVTVQTFNLTDVGLKNVKVQEPSFGSVASTVKGSPLKEAKIGTPAVWWRFDEGQGDVTTELISGSKSEIVGHKSLWKKGVSGTSLQFDGYTSMISMPAAKGPNPVDGLTLEGWISIGAYPWSWAPIIQQTDDPEEVLVRMEGPRAVLTGEENDNEGEAEASDDFTFVLKEEDDTGYYLGINGLGNPGLKLRVGGKWEELVSEQFLERRKWYHIVGTYDGQTGMMKLYVNGIPAGKKLIDKNKVILSNKDIKIGKGKPRRPIKPVRANTFSDSYGIDGLLDEVKIYETSLTAEEIANIYKEVKPDESIVNNADMVERVLPTGKDKCKFGAHYERLDFYETWDNLWRFGDHPDVVVEFDKQPGKFIFWRGVGYIPMMVNDKGHWYTNEFNETWNRSGGQGCQEPMSDKEAYTNHARIIENTEARVVVHWRYPLVDVLHVTANYNDKTGWGDWSDWYYYIYPDGVAVKTMHLWTDGERDHEWHESICVFGPDQHPEDVLEKEPALILASLDGEVDKYDWLDGPPHWDEVNFDNKKIHIVNFQSDYNMYTIGDFQGGGIYDGEITEYSVFPTWNHWPVGQMPSDGRYASFPDRTGHSSLTGIDLPTYKEDFSDRPFEEKLLMEGVSNKSPEELVPLAKSWLYPAEVEIVKGSKNAEYDPAQRAYNIDATGSMVVLKLNGSKDSPVVNPAFVISNLKGDLSVSINGVKITDSEKLKIGYPKTVIDKDLVVWIEYESESEIEIVFEAKK